MLRDHLIRKVVLRNCLLYPCSDFYFSKRFLKLFNIKACSFRVKEMASSQQNSIGKEVKDPSDMDKVHNYYFYPSDVKSCNWKC